MSAPATSMSESELQALYQWVDEIPLSRPKRNIARDFSDGVLIAEILKFYFPKLIELHNYSTAHSLDQKLYNWRTLNVKAFRKLNFEVEDEDVNDICNVTPGSIERFLRALQSKVTQITQRKKTLDARGPASPPPPHRGVQPQGAFSQQRVQGATPRGGQQQQYDTHGLLAEKEETIHSLRETIVILNEKVRKLEDLLRVKDNKYQSLQDKIATSGPGRQGMR